MSARGRALLGQIAFCALGVAAAGSQGAARAAKATICGFRIGRVTIGAIVARLGPPDKFGDWPNWEDDGSSGAGTRFYYWHRGGVLVEVTTGYYSDESKDATVESIETIGAWGGARDGELGTSGPGLALGNDLGAVERIFGQAARRQNEREYDCSLGDGVMLDVYLDFGGRVRGMEMYRREDP